MNREEAKNLRVMCDKNSIWEKIKVTVELWTTCIDKERVTDRQIETFKEFLTGFLVVEHDKGKPIKMFKEMTCGNKDVFYTVLRKAMQFSGISILQFSGRIERMTLYPSGDLKVEFINGRTEWR